MKSSLSKIELLFAASILSGSTAFMCIAGTAQTWESLPKPVQDAVLANGGKAGNVDKESESVNGKALYEVSIKSADGVVKDLDITEDGKLVETKTDDAADAAQERVDRAKKLLANVKFSHPTDITHPFLPLVHLRQDILDGLDEGKKSHVERTAKPDIHKTFKIGDQTVESAAFEDRAFEDGKLVEVAMDYFAQDDKGTVYYLGEDVDEYKNGQIVGHEGGWLLGKDTQAPGVLLPGELKVGEKFRSEDVSDAISERDEVVCLTETVTVPAGTFANCVKIKEMAAGEEAEYKYYARGIGVVREVPAGGDEQLISHASK